MIWIVEKALVIFIGCFLIAVGVNVFLVPLGLLDGGALGISLIFHYLINAKVGFTFLLVSIPIFLIAWFYYRRFFINGIHGMLFSSLFIDVLEPWRILNTYLAITTYSSAALGGFFIGAGVGFLFRFEISIGGTDLLAQMLAKRMDINPGTMIFAIDVIIVSVGSYVLHSIQILPSFLTIIVAAITISLITMKSDRAVLIGGK